LCCKPWLFPRVWGATTCNRVEFNFWNFFFKFGGCCWGVPLGGFLGAFTVGGGWGAFSGGQPPPPALALSPPHPVLPTFPHHTKPTKKTKKPTPPSFFKNLKKFRHVFWGGCLLFSCFFFFCPLSPPPTPCFLWRGPPQGSPCVPRAKVWVLPPQKNPNKSSSAGSLIFFFGLTPPPPPLLHLVVFFFEIFRFFFFFVSIFFSVGFGWVFFSKKNFFSLLVPHFPDCPQSGPTPNRFFPTFFG